MRSSGSGPTDRTPAFDHLPGRPRPGRRMALHLPAGRGDHRLHRRGVDGRPDLWDRIVHPDDIERVMGAEIACALEGSSARHRLPDPQARRRDDLGPRPRLGRKRRRERRNGGRGPDHRHQRAACRRGPAPIPGRARRADRPDQPAAVRGGRRRGDRVEQPAGGARRHGDHRPRSPEAGQRQRSAAAPATGSSPTSRRCSARISAAGSCSSRLDSDEFGLLMPGVGEAQALERAGSLLAMIRAPDRERRT